MRFKETFTQEALRTILPSKIALVADLLSKRSGEDPCISDEKGNPLITLI